MSDLKEALNQKRTTTTPDRTWTCTDAEHSFFQDRYLKRSLTPTEYHKDIDG